MVKGDTHLPLSLTCSERVYLLASNSPFFLFLINNFLFFQREMRATAKKQNRSQKDRSGATSPISDVENATTAQKKPRRGGAKTVPSHKITEFFHVRRSVRKTGKQIELEAKEALKEKVHSCSNEKLLEIFTDDVKGRGIRTTTNFSKGEFVIEYRGDMMEYSKARIIESEYSYDEQIGSYMYFFEHKGKKWCIDATKESEWKGRLINHSVLKPNLKTRVVDIDGNHHLMFFANREIAQGEELLYDYGDRSSLTKEHCPWIAST
uniref:[histone H4]-lysine(20) N-methyltransferase n=1 Tax=Caenorhabditis tropicalis TaxID=1561998 RepID=A0A1I7UMM1_9PELO